jgi:hypothetical protein
LTLLEVVLAASTLQEGGAATAPLVVPVERWLARLDTHLASCSARTIDWKGRGGRWRSGSRGLVLDALLAGCGRRKAIFEVLVPDLVARAGLVVGVAVGALYEPMTALTPLIVPVHIVGIDAGIHTKRPSADTGAALSLTCDVGCEEAKNHQAGQR